MALVGSLLFCTDCGSILERHAPDHHLIKCDVCSTLNKSTMTHFKSAIPRSLPIQTSGPPLRKLPVHLMRFRPALSTSAQTCNFSQPKIVIPGPLRQRAAQSVSMASWSIVISKHVERMREALSSTSALLAVMGKCIFQMSWIITCWMLWRFKEDNWAIGSGCNEDMNHFVNYSILYPSDLSLFNSFTACCQ